MSTPLTPEKIAFYQENGYLVVENHLSADECGQFNLEAERVLTGPHSNLLNIHDRSEQFLTLLRRPNILSYLDQIQQTRAIPIGSIYFFCKPGNVLEQGSVWHQDNYAAKAPYGSYIVCGVAFDAADAANGSLVVFPGTHKLGDLPNSPSKNFDFDAAGNVTRAYPIGNPVALPSGYEPLQLTYSAGSLIFLHGHIVHGAPRNASETRWRRKLYMHYIKDGDPFWPGWNARRSLIERA